MPMIAAGAGVMAGGYAAKALGADKANQKGPAGGGIPGVTASQGGGKDGTEGSVPQVDPTRALEYFQQATAAQKAGYEQGLNYYSNAIGQAQTTINKSYTTGNNTLQGLSHMGKEASNQMMRMLGLDPMQSTANYGAGIRQDLAIAQASGGVPQGLDAVANSLADQMDAATSIKDPEKRKTAVANIQAAYSTMSQGVLSGLGNTVANMKAPTGPDMTALGFTKVGTVSAYDKERLRLELVDWEKNRHKMPDYDWKVGREQILRSQPLIAEYGGVGYGKLGTASYDASGDYDPNKGYTRTTRYDENNQLVEEFWAQNSSMSSYLGSLDSEGQYSDRFISSGIIAADVSAAQEAYWNKRKAYDAQKAAAQATYNSGAGYLSKLKTSIDDFASNYTDNYDRGYTGAEVEGVVSSLPGYQFQMKQGLQALDRKGAAAGMLGSTNTGLAEQDYAQGQAMSYYNNYMGQLQQTAQMGNSATAQISANQINQGNTIASLQQSLGAAQMDTQQRMADYAANMLYESGVLFNNTAMFNANLQFQGQQKDKDRAANASNAALGSAAGLMQAGTNAQNNAGYGRGFLASQFQSASNPYIGNTKVGGVSGTVQYI